MSSRSISQDDIAIKQLKKYSILVSKNSGFDEAEKGAIDDLAEMILDYVASIVEECQELSILAGRSKFNLFDITDSLDKIQVKQNIDDIIAYITDHKFKIKPEKSSTKNVRSHEAETLRIGDDRPMPSYIPSYLPKFPNPHTYIKTDIVNEIEISYPRAREILAQNKRNSENSLYCYALNVHDNFCLFQMQYEEALEKAKKEVEQQEAERLAKRARYNDELNVDSFDTVDTPITLAKKKISDDFFILNPFLLNDSTLLSIVDPLVDEEDEEDERLLENNKDNDTDDDLDIELDLENDTGSAIEQDDHHDSKLSDTQDEIIVSESDEDN